MYRWNLSNINHCIFGIYPTIVSLESAQPTMYHWNLPNVNHCITGIYIIIVSLESTEPLYRWNVSNINHCIIGTYPTMYLEIGLVVVPRPWDCPRGRTIFFIMVSSLWTEVLQRSSSEITNLRKHSCYLHRTIVRVGHQYPAPQ